MQLDKHTKKVIKCVCETVIDELKKNNLLKDTSDIINHDVSKLLYNYYKESEADITITNVLADFLDDPYYNIIPLYYKSRYKIESIAEIMNCDTSTIVRNKKRLCTAIYLHLNR